MSKFIEPRFAVGDRIDLTEAWSQSSPLYGTIFRVNHHNSDHYTYDYHSDSYDYTAGGFYPKEENFHTLSSRSISYELYRKAFILKEYDPSQNGDTDADI